MAWTGTTTAIADVAKEPGGGSAIPFAVVVSWPRNSFTNGQVAAAHSVVALANGVFSLTALECTDDNTTTCTDTLMTDMPFSAGPTNIAATDHFGSHHVLILDPRSGEHAFDADVIVPSGTGKPTNLKTLAACAV